MAKNYFKRYIWLVDLINRRGPISFRDISDAWRRSPLNETGDPLSERTFFNHKDAIAGMFGIEILNDRSLGFYIGHTDVGNDDTGDWMLHALCMNNVLQENSDMKDRIIVEKIPSSEKFLTEVISAMRDSRVISLCYQSFRRPEPHCFNVSPYCVKHFKQRWYMLGNSDLGLRIYSLDRFVDMEELEERFVLPKDFDAEEYFRNYFGVIIGEAPVNVKIRVVPDQVKYFRSLPLHESQKETVQEDGSSVFSYHIAPTFDFVQEILSHGADVEVLESAELRKRISDDVVGMAARYGIHVARQVAEPAEVPPTGSGILQ
ncbi:MAG TPA: WYL domain-containing protein [Rikenellaceae bacterium]|nr:WYL domain-containing protein [Rikenellaceae bacterium]